MDVGNKVVILQGRLKGEKGTFIGTTDLNMDHRLIVRRENKRARNKIMGFRPEEVQSLERR